MTMPHSPLILLFKILIKNLCIRDVQLGNILDSEFRLWPIRQDGRKLIFIPFFLVKHLIFILIPQVSDAAQRLQNLKNSLFR